MLIVPILSSSLPQNHFTRCTKTASKFILYCSDIEQAKPRCTALEDRSGIDPVTQSKELHTFYAKINSVSVTEQKKHKSKRDKIWTCAFFQPNPNCCQLLAAFWSINSFQLVQWSPFYLLVQRRLLTAAVNVITFWYWEKKKTELHLKLGNLQSSEAFRCIIYFFRALHEKFLPWPLHTTYVGSQKKIGLLNNSGLWNSLLMNDYWNHIWSTSLGTKMNQSVQIKMLCQNLTRHSILNCA